ncbi:MAG: dipeptidase [Verrucomicrobia bacterium]|nr:dipeptidase [Verrucomicrobiota bacterium]
MPASKLSAKDALAKAHALLERVPLIDGHNDLPWLIRRDPNAPGDLAAYDLKRSRRGRETDIPKLRAGRVSAQFWAAFVPTKMPHPARTTLEQIELIRRMNARHADAFLAATSAADVALARKQGKIASFIAVESGVGLENSLDLLSVWHALGVRYVTLCHNETLDWVDSATDEPRHGGLTDFGRAVIREMNRLGLIVDLAHTTAQVMHQTLDLTTVPIAITHANARSLCDHPRNVTDDVLVRLRRNDGIVMATFVPDFISQASRDWDRPFTNQWGARLHGPEIAEAMREHERLHGPCPRATIPQLCDHLEHLVQQAGVDHVGIGSDFFGGVVPQGLENVTCFPALFAALYQRGFSERDLAKIAGGNFLRVFRAVEAATEKR